MQRWVERSYRTGPFDVSERGFVLPDGSPFGRREAWFCYHRVGGPAAPEYYLLQECAPVGPIEAFEVNAWKYPGGSRRREEAEKLSAVLNRCCYTEFNLEDLANREAVKAIAAYLRYLEDNGLASVQIGRFGAIVDVVSMSDLLQWIDWK